MKYCEVLSVRELATGLPPSSLCGALATLDHLHMCEVFNVIMCVHVCVVCVGVCVCSGYWPSPNLSPADDAGAAVCLSQAPGVP